MAVNWKGILGANHAATAKAIQEAKKDMEDIEKRYLLGGVPGPLGGRGGWPGSLASSSNTTPGWKAFYHAMRTTDAINPPEIIHPVTGQVIAKLKEVEPRKIERKIRIPDSFEMMTGWRAWRRGYFVCEDGTTELRLQAVGQATFWPPKKKMKATCVSPRPLGHPAPFRSCDCGFWAFKNVEMLPEALSGQNHEDDVAVIGPVHLWGHVIETNIGFRAEYAYPKELWLLKDGLEDLGWIYGVPVRALGNTK